jgi:hypothetical protein
MIRRLTPAVLLAWLVLWNGTALAERSVVLVTNDHCSISKLSNLEIRKAYLGVTVSVGGQAIRPLRLAGDPELDQVFFQTIVAMSEKSYERRALSLALKFGTPRPTAHESVEQALATLERTPCGVLFLWAEDARRSNNTKTIRVLWQGN